MKLSDKLDAWKQASLIDAAQSDAIARYEKENATDNRWAIWVIGALGVLTVTAGIIALIAANWNDISDAVKLGAWFCLLLGTLGVAWATRNRASRWFTDGALLLHQGLVPAGIGLVAQIYHLSGSPWKPWAMAAAFALGPAVLSKRALLTDVMLAFATGSYFAWSTNVSGSIATAHLGFLTATIALGLFGASRFLSAIRPSAASAFFRWGAAYAVTMTVIAATMWPRPGWRTYACEGTHCFTWATGLFIASAVLFAVHNLLEHRPGFRSRIAATFCFLVLVGGAWLGRFDWEMTRTLLGFALFCAMGLAATVALSVEGHRTWASLASLAVAGRVLVLYFELVKDLSTTGLSLIVAGLIFVALAWGWWRLQPKLNVLAKSAEAL